MKRKKEERKIGEEKKEKKIICFQLSLLFRLNVITGLTRHLTQTKTNIGLRKKAKHF